MKNHPGSRNWTAGVHKQLNAKGSNQSAMEYTVIIFFIFSFWVNMSLEKKLFLRMIGTFFILANVSAFK